MSSAQDLRKRIKSVTNTEQITKAMKMVASARLRRAQAKAKATEPYAKGLKTMLSHAVNGLDRDEVSNPILDARPVKKTLYVLVGADKGLAGAYTSNLIKFFTSDVKELDKETYEILAVGRKPTEYTKGHKYPLIKSFTGFSDKPLYEHTTSIVEDIVSRYTSGEVDRVEMIYTHFVNSLSQVVTKEQLLPLEVSSEEVNTEHIFTPSCEAVLEALVPNYLASTVYNALLQSAASELGARMTAMTSATDNASALIDTLNLEYNKLRQASITNELSEIVGGANALQ